MNLDEYRKRFNAEGETPGWDAIDSALEGIYAEQKPLVHWAPRLSYLLSGANPLEGISAYDSSAGNTDHLHFCSYGLSSLYYDEESVGGDYSKFGFELTFRLLPKSPQDDPPTWVCRLMQDIATYVFESGTWFEEYHWVRLNGPLIDNDDTDSKDYYDTSIVGLALVRDPELKTIVTPHGKVEFLQMFGITQIELDDLVKKKRPCQEIIEEHRKTNPYFITDTDRKAES